jgi:hypothetical protein
VKATRSEFSISETIAIDALVEQWPGPESGLRHQAFAALVGGLLRGGLKTGRVEQIVEALAEQTGDEEAEKRIRLVLDTARKLQKGEAVTGWPRLLTFLGPGGAEAVKQMHKAFRIKSQIVATYTYCSEGGAFLFETVRLLPKDFRQRRRDGKGGWIWDIKGVPRVLYRLPQLLNADPAQPVFITEGEKDADNLAALDLVATTNAMGAGTWRDEYSNALRDRHVVILPDNDTPGRDHAQKVMASLKGVAKSVKVLELPNLPPGGDVSDWLAAGGTKEALLQMVAAAPGEAIAAEAAETLPVELPWPEPPGEPAFYGLPGEIVRVILPASEADATALLVQVLVAFGNVIGRNAHFLVEADRHHGNENAVFVGKSSKARKGTSWGRVKGLFLEVEELWATDRVQTGLSSGEGLIWAVRDPIFKQEKVKEDSVVFYQEVQADPGVEDKRLLVFEPEFANVLKQTERQGNTLSPIIRQGWDGHDLRTMTKNSPARATKPHISLIGHITADELRRYLTLTESANGFANRHLFVCTDRSKQLPEGGRVDERAWKGLRGQLTRALATARTLGEMTRDEDARAVWREVYGPLSSGKPGLAGALLARAEAHVLRLAMLYALTEGSAVIKAPHLLAALALWDYVERSVYYLFGDALGDPLADDVRRLLQASPDGLTRTDLYHALGRHQSSERIGRALGLLLSHRLIRMERQETSGRTAERWFAVSPRRS